MFLLLQVCIFLLKPLRSDSIDDLTGCLCTRLLISLIHTLSFGCNLGFNNNWRNYLHIVVTIIPILVWFILLCLPFFQNWKSDEAIVTIRRASLSDLSCLDDVDLLSVRQLKEILARNFVNFTGCCEKWELMERVRRLYLEQQRLQGENKNVMKRYTTKEASSHSFKNCVLNNFGTSSFWYSFKSALNSY